MKKQPGILSEILTQIRDAISGKPYDYTSGQLLPPVILLAIPMVLEMLLQASFEVVDMFFVGRLGPEAVAVVGITSILLTVVYTIALGLGMAGTAMVARRFGEKDAAGAAVAAFHTLFLGAIASVPIAIIGIFYSDHLLRALGASPDVIRNGSVYCSIVLGCSPVVMMFFVISSVFRGAGDATIAMRVLWFSIIVNIVLDPLLIFGLGPFPRLGVAGAAIASVTGRGVGVMAQLFFLCRGSRRLRVTVRDMRLDTGILRRLLSTSLTGMLQYSVLATSHFGLIRIIAAFGSNAVAGYTIAIRAGTFALLPCWGLGNAAATLVGQNLGAGKPNRAERSAWIAACFSAGLLGSAAIVFISFAEPIIGIFTSQREVVQVGSDYIRYVGCSYVFMAFGIVIGHSFNGAGDTRTPARINLICYWLIQLPSAYILSTQFGLGVNGAFLAISATQIILAVISVAVFRRGQWKLRRI